MKKKKQQHIESRIPVGWDKVLLDSGVNEKIYWYPERASPMVLVAGQSGSGKTKWMELFASRCIRGLPGCELFLADPKRLDFRYAKGSARYWAGMDSIGALMAFKDSMMARVDEADSLEKNTEPEHWNWKILMFDEIAAFTLLQNDKKKRAEIQDTLASILLMGRGVRHVIVVAVQKALMEFFGSGGRSQFGTILLIGDTSNDKEQVQMLMKPYAETINATHNTRGQFWVTQDGEGIRRGQTPWIENTDEVRRLIIEGLNRNHNKALPD
jgi:hypothetical protein